MKKLSIAVAVILLLAMVVVSIDSIRTHSTARRAQAIKVGDSKRQVEQLLGRPITTFTPSPEARTNFLAALLNVDSETWAYGSRFELQRPFHAEFPYFYPFRLRLFRPETNDVALEFDSSGKVSKIKIP